MRHRVPWLSAAAVLLLAACGTDDPDQGMAGFGLPTVAPDDIDGPRTELAGTLHVERDGCFTWSGDDDVSERRWAVWPASASHDGDHVALGDGSTVTEGDAVVGTGVRAEASSLPEWDERDSYFHSFGTFCGAAERGIVVFDDVQRPNP